MGELFTGKAISKTVSMPKDMWAYFEQRRETIGIPVSRQIQDILEKAIEADIEPAHSLVDSPVEYVPEEA